MLQGASKEVSSVEVRRTLSWIGVFVLVLLQVNVMLYYNYIQSNYASYVGNEWYSQAVPAVVYYGLCNLSSALLYPITTILTDFEMHPTKVMYPFFLFFYYATNASLKVKLTSIPFSEIVSPSLS